MHTPPNASSNTVNNTVIFIGIPAFLIMARPFDISNKYDIENEQNKAFIEKRLNLQNENITTRGALGKTLDINIHSVDYHIQQGHLKLNADGKIDLTDELNKKFVENFQKGERQSSIN